MKSLSFAKPSARQSFSLFQQAKERKERILQERSQSSKYETKLKLMSLFYIALAIFLLLNACIGFSSSPYYERYTSCEKYDLTAECKSLRHRVNVIYSCELVGSVALVVHGLIGMILYDNMRVIWIAKLLSCYSRLSILGYALIIVIRTSYYIDIVPML